jgi:hypothetical protein
MIDTLEAVLPFIKVSDVTFCKLNLTKKREGLTLI